MITDLLDGNILVTKTHGATTTHGLSPIEEEIITSIPLTKMYVDLIDEYENGDNTHKIYQAVGLIYIDVKAKEFPQKLTIPIVSFIDAEGRLRHLPFGMDVKMGTIISSDAYDYIKIVTCEEAQKLLNSNALNRF